MRVDRETGKEIGKQEGLCPPSLLQVGWGKGPPSDATHWSPARKPGLAGKALSAWATVLKDHRKVQTFLPKYRCALL